jgi:hypothetical protein
VQAIESQPVATCFKLVYTALYPRR